MAERLQVFGHLNHLSHQYDMLKLAKRFPVKFTYLETNVRKWSRYSGRPEPTTWLTSNEFEWTTYYEPGKYDLAILHCDQQAVDPVLGKGWPIRHLDKLIKNCPKIIVNHGTPCWSEAIDENMVLHGGYVPDRNGKVRKIDGMRDLVANAALMIVNSYHAVERWGDVHPHIYPLIHGLDISEWEPFDLPKEPRVVLPVSPAGLDKYYNRSLITAIKAAVKEKTGLDVLHFNVNVEFKEDHFYQYRQFFGSSLISIFPFWDSPMPRSRTEAFLMGSCVLSSKHANASEFIDHGVNGFLMPDNPLSYASAVDLLINQAYRSAVEIGQRGKEMAQKNFALPRYQEDLWHILQEVANGRTPVWNGQKVWERV